MSTEQVSSADKAELRRQKILAKKAARMAYAAGDRSKPPSTLPLELTNEPTTPALAERPQPALASAHSLPQLSSQSSLSRTALEDLLIRPGDNAQLPVPLTRRPNLNLGGFQTKAQRLCFFAMIAIAYTVAVFNQSSSNWSISMVELFFGLEAILITPSVISICVAIDVVDESWKVFDSAESLKG